MTLHEESSGTLRIQDINRNVGIAVVVVGAGLSADDDGK
jgi:hypothetical protein